MFRFFILMSLAISYSFSSNAQYKSMFETNAYWNIYNVQHTLYYEAFVDSVYLSSSQTKINGKDYYTIYSRFIDTQFSPQKPLGFVREDTTTGKAWYLPDTFNMFFKPYDILIYDLSLSKNDTFVVDTGGFYSNIQLIVDTTYFKNNKKILKLHLLNKDSFELDNTRKTPQTKAIYKYDTLLFMEGIGTTKGIDFPIPTANSKNGVGSSHRLLCVYDTSNVKVFQHQLTPIVPFLVGCDTIHLPGPIVGLTGFGMKSKKINIIPNPTKELIKISNSERINTIQIYNLQGQKVQEVMPNRLSETQVQLQGAPGVYIIQIQMEDGSVESAKVIKQ